MTLEEDLNISELSQLPGNIFCEMMMRLKLAKPGVAATRAGLFIFFALTFLPLLVMCAINGSLLPGNVAAPLLMDFTTVTRFLIVAPLLMIADLVAKPMLLRVAQNFLEQKLIGDAHIAEYKGLVSKIIKLRTSMKIEIALLIVSLLSSYLFSTTLLTVGLQTSGWYFDVLSDGRHVLNNAGNWSTFVSQPLFRFVVLDWLYEYLLWLYYLAKVVRFPLTVMPTHADAAGGLGFISVGQTQFCVSAFALSAAFTSVIADAVYSGLAKLQSFTNVGVAWVIFVLLVFLGPLLMFTPTLVRAKRNALFAYSNLCHSACASFEQKWFPGGKISHESVLDCAEVSALADLNADFHAITDMRVLIFSKHTVSIFLVATVLPALPLVLTVVPLDELIKQALKALT